MSAVMMLGQEQHITLSITRRTHTESGKVSFSGAHSRAAFVEGTALLNWSDSNGVSIDAICKLKTSEST